MKLLFATLLCHRDVEIFKFNWFTMRQHLDQGFEIPHLILNDGSLTEADFNTLAELPKVFVEKEPVKKLNNLSRAIVLSKLDCFERGFNQYQADRVVILDADIFFYKNWEADLRKICNSPAICLRDWGSGIGPNPEKVKALFGHTEDAITPSCNTGIYSIPKEQYHKVKPVLEKHLQQPFDMMHDQGIFFATYYGEIEFIEKVQCLVIGGEGHPDLIDWMLHQNACHLMGMRERLQALKFFLEHSRNSWTNKHLSQFKPIEKEISFGILDYGTYDYTKPFQHFPSTHLNTFVTDALYLHAGSRVKWQLSEYYQKFTTEIICLDTGRKQINQIKIRVNDRFFKVGDRVEIPLNGELEIESEYSDWGHLAYLSPNLLVNKNIKLPQLLS